MTFNEWVQKYKPINDAQTFETYGEEYEFVKAQSPLTIWTLCSGDFGDYILSGWHFVNRIAYYITEIPFEIGEQIFIDVEEEDGEY